MPLVAPVSFVLWPGGLHFVDGIEDLPEQLHRQRALHQPAFDVERRRALRPGLDRALDVALDFRPRLALLETLHAPQASGA